MFQSQTGSQALSDADASASSGAKLLFQSQTGSQALSDLCPPEEMDEKMSSVSIPNGKSGPLRLPVYEAHRQAVNEFQSQTGSQALSDADPTEGRSRGYGFQSQTGSQALSDANPIYEHMSASWFQSQTGSQALSDYESS